MSAVFRELELSWGGQTYRVKPTMALLNRIEQDVSLSSVAFKFIRMEPPVAQFAIIIAAFLNEAGCKVTADEIFAELSRDLLLGDPEQFQQMAEAVFGAIFPNKGKVEAPVIQRSTQNSTGATTTRLQ